MSGEKVLETEIHFEVAAFAPEAFVVILAATENFERLRLDFRFSVCRVKYGEVPVTANLVRAIAVNLILRDFDNSGGIVRHGAQVLLQNGSLRWRPPRGWPSCVKPGFVAEKGTVSRNAPRRSMMNSSENSFDHTFR